jgi:hypothetical protein
MNWRAAVRVDQEQPFGPASKLVSAPRPVDRRGKIPRLYSDAPATSNAAAAR